MIDNNESIISIKKKKSKPIKTENQTSDCVQGTLLPYPLCHSITKIDVER